MIANSWAGLAYERDEQRVDSAKLCVIPNGIDIERFKPGRADGIRKEFNIPQDATVVGMFAHFRGNKDHATLIDAARKVLSNHRHVYFLLVGGFDGTEPNTLHGQCRAAVNRYGMGDRVIFAGHRSDMAQLYRAIDIKVL
ncbi:MAG: glycosyltransferase, partial [Planctomycetes bacterium]|nr:glycosyltransferase [Planctomycetota bacterium]